MTFEMTASTTETAIALLADLVGFDTTSHKSNLDIIAYIEAYLARHGVSATRIVSADGEKANLYASIGPANVSGGVALSGHTDVVPVTGQAWTHDPFEMVRRDGRLYGRGTADMKGFLACVLTAVPAITHARLRVPIHLAFSYDEEVGCIGVRPMINAFDSEIARPDIVIVGEPTGMQVVDLHKGPARWRVDVTGRSAHSSMAPLGVNAIATAGRLMAEVEAIADDFRTGPPSPRFDPPYATLQVTKIQGGSAANIVPASCAFEFDLRAVPGVDPDKIESRLQAVAERDLLPAMRAVAPEADITITRLNMVPPFIAGDNAPAVTLALRLLEQNETFAVSYATEAGLFQSAKTSAVVCGPGHISEAHTADEWIEESEITKCCAFIDRLIAWASH